MCGASRKSGAAEDPEGSRPGGVPLRHRRPPDPVAGARGRRSDRDRVRQYDQRGRAGNVRVGISPERVWLCTPRAGTVACRVRMRAQALPPAPLVTVGSGTMGSDQTRSPL
uniref:Uncharacterized protein n=1 Tax=Rhodococcus sp. NS1 TaxID=402236 RepID=A0A097SQ62_9NOCA|nr:hypothetical protein LRS1606.226 [Rhodococcus sp. NS1]